MLLLSFTKHPSMQEYVYFAFCFELIWFNFDSIFIRALLCLILKASNRYSSSEAQGHKSI